MYIRGKRLFFDELSRESISAKSKADLLAKGLAVCQVSWLMVQSIARHIAKLPLTLLEIHTVVHIFIALSMYCAWLRKPKSVLAPTRIDASHRGREALLAEMIMWDKFVSKNQPSPKG